MTCHMFARWFGVVSVLLSLGILFNLDDALDMAKNMVKTETGYIMGGVLPIIFGSLSLLFMDCFHFNWHLVVTIVSASMLLAGTYRVIFVSHWKALMTKHLEDIPFLFSLFGLMLGVVLLYVGFIANTFNVTVS
ncbi:MAG: hypothetical protein A3E85_05045 [Gammaproteobacteria bacterium RIFCSPHIGHO2_12_FULL_45_12]|nr:MAG: hypothetical protein A3E85_05045 [Gammaproteobacteria bacterium RIFCSPHIGHO2_12_FULL_45_12]